MKTTVFLATLLCWELVCSYPFPGPLPSYYGSYEPVGVPEKRVISQPIQIPNLAHSQNPELTYQQQRLAYLQQENLRRQNYENLLRHQEQQAALDQRIADQLLIPQQPDNNYNNPIPLNTVRESYINSIPLQRPIEQTQYEAPITQQYYQNQQFREPTQALEAPQPFETLNPEPKLVAEPTSPAQPNYQYNQQYPPVPQYNAQNVLYHPRIKQAIGSTPLKKRYLVLHPNGTIEHIDRIEQIIQRHPNYIFVNAGDISKIKDGVIPAPVQPVEPISPLASVSPVAPAPLDPKLPANATGPVPPVAPLTPVVPTPKVPSEQLVSTTPAPSVALPPPTILNGTVPGSKPTVPPPTGSTTTTKTVTAQSALPPQPLSTTLAPPPLLTTTATGEWPPVDVTTTPVPPVETTITPPVVNATAVYPLPDPTSTTTENPTITTSSAVTATAEDPPPSDVTTIPTPVTDPTVTPSVVTATSTEIFPLKVTTENPVTPAPENATTIAVPKDPAVPTNVTSVEIPSDAVADATVTKSTDLTSPDFPFDKIPTDPIVWFRSKDLNFFDKLTSGNETFDIVYFFNVPREPRVLKDTRTTIHADGTIVEETVETIYDDEDAPPRVIKTRKVTNPDDAQPKT